MKNKNRFIALSVTVCVLVSLIIPLAMPIISFANEEAVHINNADEFIEFAKKCSYDAWSIGKTFLLNADISLEGKDFVPIPSFSGIFDGQGHTLSGIELDGAYSPAGVFSSLEKDAVIKNLKVEGVIAPGGDRGVVGGIVGNNSGRIEGCSFNGTVIGKSDVGGIVGVNKVSGSVSTCTTNGEIVGENRTGGIVGCNEGLISSCESYAKINTVSINPSISLDEINISLTLDITKLPSLNNSSMSDTGGIVGYSTGMIIGCKNHGKVGYPHIGYNVGGIVGRSSGHLANNTNRGEIFGRKDVGGIAGQVEPNISFELSEDLLKSLKAELDSLSDVVSDALNNADSDVPNLSGRLDAIIQGIDNATNSLNKLINGATAYGNDMFGEVNRLSEIINEVISQVSGITDDIPELTKIFSSGLSELESALSNLESFSSVTSGALGDVVSAIDELSTAFGKISESINGINGGLEAFESALTIKDKNAAQESIKQIADELSAFVTAVDVFTNSIDSVTELLGDTPWADKLLKNVTDLSVIFKDVSASVSKIYDATVVIGESIDVYWDKFEEAGDELINAVGHFTDMTVAIADAIELLDGGFEKITDGFEMLAAAVTVGDQATADEAIKNILLGFENIVSGADAISLAFEKLSVAIEMLDGSEALEDILSTISDPIKDLVGAASNILDGVESLSDGLTKILSDVKIDFDSISNGGTLILGGAGDIDTALNKLKDAVRAMSNGMIALESAIVSINEAVVIKDEAALKSALNNAYEALGKIIESMKETATVFEDMAETLGLVMAWSDELTELIGGVTEAMTKMSGALVNVQSGIDSLRNNISFDIDSAEEGLKLIKSGLSKMADASEDLKECFGHISDAMTKIDGGSEYLTAFVTDFKEFISAINSAAELITDISSKLNGLVGYLKDIDPIQLPTLPESMINEANQLFIYINNIEAELKNLNADITSLSDEMVEKIGKINEIFNAISNNLVDMIYGLNDGSIFDSSVSEDEINLVTKGKLFSCVNYGDVQGDINVGGIGGTMGLEYALDPEDDMSVELSVTQKKQYRLKAILHACINYGSITSKRDCVGGVVGKMDIGLIYGCESNCRLESLSGNYVGGIAGITAGLISNCFAKCSLYGGKYVGGIVGSGVTEDISGASSVVKGCYSMVEIRRFTQYAGAISGVNAGDYSENMFVSNKLAGIDRVSYLGKAEPITYEDLVKRRSIANGFYRFVLKFMVDGKLLYSTEFNYGDSIDPSIFPDIPAKDGYYAYWDRTDLTNLVFDTEVHAVYKPYIPTIKSGETRDDKRPIFFVQGEFIEGHTITVKSGCDTSGLTLIDKLFTKDSLVESWILTIPDDNLEVNNIHFLPENEHCRIFIKINGAWQQVEAEEFGSYISFDTNGKEIEIAIVEHETKWTPIIILAGCVLFVILATVTAIIVIKKKKAKKTVKTA